MSLCLYSVIPLTSSDPHPLCSPIGLGMEYRGLRRNPRQKADGVTRTRGLGLAVSQAQRAHLLPGTQAAFSSGEPSGTRGQLPWTSSSSTGMMAGFQVMGLVAAGVSWPRGRREEKAVRGTSSGLPRELGSLCSVLTRHLAPQGAEDPHWQGLELIHLCAPSTVPGM